MNREHVRRRLLAAGAGLAMALALPGPGLVPLVLLVPGMLRRAVEGTRGWRAFRLGWLAGFAEWVVAVAWVVIVIHRYGHLPLALAVLGLVFMASVLGLGWGIVAWGVGRAPASWRVWLLPLGLAAFEEAQRFPPWIFPWDPAAAALTPVPSLLAPAPVIGAAGLSFLVFLTGSALERIATRNPRKIGAVWLACSVAVWVGSGLAAPTFQPAGPGIKVAALQPNVPLEMRWEASSEHAIEDRVWALTRQAATAGARWVVWPESAVPRWVERDGEYRSAVEALARETRAWLTVGSIGFGKGEDVYYNSVFSFAPTGLTPGRYDKIHLVPFGEYVPLAGRIAALEALVHEVGSFTPGESATRLAGPLGPVGVAVCYEVAYPSLYAEEARRGAVVLATITNDGWYGDSAAPRQHLALAILRAAENRRYLVRAANTGISAIIDPDGRQLARLDFGREGLITGEVRPSTSVTPYARFGGGLRAAILVLAAGGIILAAVRRGRD